MPCAHDDPNAGDRVGQRSRLATAKSDYAAAYFLTPTWFLDLNYTYAATAGHTASFASPFLDHSSTSGGTLVGNPAWRTETQWVGLTINKAF